MKRVSSQFSILDEKKAISDIVIMLIILALVLGAVALVWVIVQGIIKGGTENINLGSKCLSVDIKETSLKCSGANNATCDVTLKRNAGGDDIAGVKLIFTNASETQNFVYDLPGNIVPLQTKTQTAIVTGITNANKVGIVAYFNDSTGNQQVCQTI